MIELEAETGAAIWELSIDRMKQVQYEQRLALDAGRRDVFDELFERWKEYMWLGWDAAGLSIEFDDEH